MSKPTRKPLELHSIWMNFCQRCQTHNPAPAGDKVQTCSGCGQPPDLESYPRYAYEVWTPGAELRPQRRKRKRA